MFNYRFVPYLIVVGIVALLSVCYVGYRKYQEHTKFEVFMSKVQVTLDNDTSSPKQTEVQPQRNEPATTTRERIDVSAPPIQVGVHSKEEEAEFESIDWSEISPELRAKWEHFDPGPMTLQRIQTPNGNVHFIELPAGIDYGEVDITVSEDMTSQPTFPPTGSFAEIVSVQKSDIPEGEDVEEYIYKKRWALFLGVSVEEVGKQIDRGHLPPRPSIIERTPVIEFPIDELIGNDNHSGSAVSVDEAQRSGEYRTEVSVSDGGLSEDTQRASVPADIPRSPSNLSGVLEPSRRSMTGGERTKTPTPSTAKSIETQLQKRLSPERFNNAQQLINQYGAEEGLRRLRESDPEAARRFERERRPVPSRNAPDGRQSESGSKD